MELLNLLGGLRRGLAVILIACRLFLPRCSYHCMTQYAFLLLYEIMSMAIINKKRLVCWYTVRVLIGVCVFVCVLVCVFLRADVL